MPSSVEGTNLKEPAVVVLSWLCISRTVISMGCNLESRVDLNTAHSVSMTFQLEGRDLPHLLPSYLVPPSRRDKDRLEERDEEEDPVLQNEEEADS